METVLTKTTGTFIQKKADVKGVKVEFKIMGDENSFGGFCIHKNGTYFKHSKDIYSELSKKYTKIKELDSYIAETGCHVQILEATRK